MYTSQKYIQKNFTTHNGNVFDLLIESGEIPLKINVKTRNFAILIDFNKNLMKLHIKRTFLNNKFFHDHALKIGEIIFLE